jgi:hypothetical protein
VSEMYRSYSYCKRLWNSFSFILTAHIDLRSRIKIFLFCGDALYESYPTHRNCWELNTTGRLCVQYCIPGPRQTVSHTICELRNLETTVLSNSSPVPCLLAPVLLVCTVNSGSVLYCAPYSQSRISDDKRVDSILGQREPGYVSWRATLSRAR